MQNLRLINKNRVFALIFCLLLIAGAALAAAAAAVSPPMALAAAEGDIPGAAALVVLCFRDLRIILEDTVVLEKIEHTHLFSYLESPVASDGNRLVVARKARYPVPVRRYVELGTPMHLPEIKARSDSEFCSYVPH